MLPNLWEQFGEGFILFQYDYVPVHKAWSIMSRSDDFGMEEFDCPAQSPDFNPTDHLWDELERRL